MSTLYPKESWMGFLEREFPERFSHPVIYHYTSLDVLNVFLKEESDIWCTEFSLLNDDAEVREGLACVISTLKSKFAYSPESIASINNWIDRAFQERFGLPWIASFSTEHDLLSQWMGYVDRGRGGYAIGFDFDKLQTAVCESEIDAKGNEERQQLFLFPCLYDKGDQARSAEKFITTHMNVYADFKHPQNELGEKVLRMVRATFLFAVSIKNASFLAEKEWRLVAWPCLHDEFAEVELIGGKLRIPSHLRNNLGVLRNCIREVVVSPHGDCRALKASAEILKRKYDLNYKIIDSESTYNGR